MKAARAKKPSPQRDDVGAPVAVGRRAAVARGGAVAKPSYLWALLHNWMYFLSLGLTVPNLPRIIASVVNEDGTSKVTPRAVRVSGDVEALDKTLTFLGVGFLSALSGMDTTSFGANGAWQDAAASWCTTFTARLLPRDC